MKTLQSTTRPMLVLLLALVMAVTSLTALPQAARATPQPTASSALPAAASVSPLSSTGSIMLPMISGSCKNGRCTVYLNKAETKALGNAKVPKAPRFLPLPIQAVYYATAVVHVWIAKQYAKKGWCSAFLLSSRPWENQGYKGYSC